MRNVLIRIVDLEFSYGSGGFRLLIPALRIRAQEQVAIIGPSGSGKTTLLNLIAGIAVPESGTVRVGEHEVSGLHDAARRDFRIRHIGFVFQDFELVEFLSILDNVLHPFRISSALQLSEEVVNRAVRLAKSMGLEDKLDRKPGQLSQGEKQRAALCRALLPDPQIVLADEPTGNLDPDATRQVVEYLTAHARESGATLVMVTHDHSLLGHFDRVIDFAKFSSGEAA